MSEEAGNGELITNDTADPADVRQELIARGWRQGTVLPAELAPHVLPLPHVAPFDDAGVERWYAVISQDCDLVSPHFDVEPVVEVLALEGISEVSTRHIFLRDPRELHLEVTIADETRPVAARSWRRGFLDRRLLLEHQPDRGVELDSTSIADLVSFVGRRYDRAALPDTFVERFRKGRGRIERLLRDNPDAVIDVLLGITPEGEIETEESYDLRMYILLADQIANSHRRSGLERQLKEQATAAVRRCEGIGLEIVLVVGRDQLSVREAAGLLPLDLDALNSELSRKAPE